MKASNLLIATALLTSLAVSLLTRPTAAVAAPENDIGPILSATVRESAVTKAPRPSGVPKQPARAVAFDDPDAVAVRFDDGVTLHVLIGGSIRSLSLHDYLIGVVLAEMPGHFDREALRAQAVASRSFALYKAKAHRHGQADICGSSACCQAWKNPADYDDDTLAPFIDAVESTDGLVAVYEGEVIEAAFFASTGGATEAALTVWGGDIPYLKSVVSPGEAEMQYHSVTRSFSAAEFAGRIRAAYPSASLESAPETWFSELRRTEGGGLASVSIGGVRVSGETLRSLFSLRSTEIDISVCDGAVVFRTSGYGHRVGMSQYGAQEMAKRGSSFPDILTHYYQGVTLARLTH